MQLIIMLEVAHKLSRAGVHLIRSNRGHEILALETKEGCDLVVLVHPWKSDHSFYLGSCAQTPFIFKGKPQDHDERDGEEDEDGGIELLCRIIVQDSVLSGPRIAREVSLI